MSVFHFKQFSVHHHGAAMKVGTDGVLLGAWAEALRPARRILDIGTGTGLIALMMAQRFPEAIIDAIDIEPVAALAADKNVASSPWKERIHVEHISLQHFLKKEKNRYDMIICNPPFFADGWKVEDPQRKLARDAAHLPLHLILEAAEQLLLSEGALNLILPAESGERLIRADSKWQVRRCTKVISKEGGMVKRMLMELVQFPVNTAEDTLIIESAVPNAYTEAYRKLTADFYLKF